MLGRVLVIAGIALAVEARAANFLVNSSVSGAFDALPGDGVCEATPGMGDCTLLAAVQETNALSGSDTISLPPGTYSPRPILDVRDAVIISGAGAATTFIRADAPGTLMEFYNQDITLRGLTLTGGHGINVGGALTNYDGNVTLIDCVVSGNSAFNVGGGLYNDASATMTIIGTRVTGNGALNVGGGVYNHGRMLILGSTIDHNSVLNVGGGLENEGTVEIVNSTVSHNSREGLWNEGSMVVRSSTIVDNPGAGIIDVDYDYQPQPSPTVLHNTLVLRNGTDTYGGVLGTFGAPYFDLVGSSASGVTLGPFAMNGGSTPTFALLPGSTAIDAGSPDAPGASDDACPPTDQRGVSRSQGGRCDVGAYEVTPCGNGVLDDGEECDDGANQNGDGCDANCTITRCGNGIVTAGEQCDDGNLDAGDCCTPTCALAVVEPTEPAAPSGAQVKVRLGAGGRFDWQWRGAGDAPRAIFGDPTAGTSYSLCLIDTSGATPALVSSIALPAGSGWVARVGSFSYRTTAASPGRIVKAKLKAGRPGRGKIKLQGTAPEVRLGRLPLVTPVRVLLVRGDGAVVWGATYDSSRRNRGTEFWATSR